MKPLLWIAGCGVLMLGATGCGMVTAQSRDWAFVQQTGGMRIGVPMEKGGREVLPVEYELKFNSALVVRQITAKQEGQQIVLRLVTQLTDSFDHGRSPYNVDLSGIPAGTYEVFYETAGDAAKRLGQIVVTGQRASSLASSLR